MKIYKFLHSCIVVEHESEKILFDPGSFCFLETNISPRDFTDISLIIITHEHGDHVDIPALKVILANNNVPILTNSGVSAYLKKEGVESIVCDEGTHKTNSFTIRILPAAHGKLLFPVPQNTAYAVNDVFLHPGDSFDERLVYQKGIEIVALPIVAQWTKAIEAVAFAKAMNPQTVIPIHDGFVKEFFLERQYDNFKRYFDNLGILFRPLRTTSDFVETK